MAPVRRSGLSIGRIVLFGLILSAFFFVLANVLVFVVDSIFTALSLMKDATGEPNIMGTMYTLASTVATWIRKILTNPISLAALFVVTMIYAAVTEE